MTHFCTNSLKKIFNCILISLLLFGLVLPLTACGKSKLSTPTGMNIEASTLTLSWNPVTDAAYYTVRIEGNGKTQEADSGKNSYSLERLEAGSYTIRVKAVVGANSDLFADSAWSEKISFSREQESGLIFSMINSNTAYEVSGLGIAQGDIVIPDTYRGLPVTKIGDQAFYNKNTVLSVVIGKNVTEIGERAFANCSFLTSLTLPDSLKVIGKQAFQSCRVLASQLIIPDSVTELGAQAFEYCRALPSVTFGSGLTELGESAFNGCTALKEVIIPDNIVTIGSGAFSGCSALEKVSVGSGVVNIGTDAFRRCIKLPSVTLGSRTEAIGDYAFAECTALTSVHLPDSVKNIGVQAFYGCTALKNVTLGQNIEQISKEAFHQTGIWQETGATYVGKWFLGTKDTEAPTLKDDTVGIADYAFSSCENFTDIYSLPDSVKYIGEGAFSGRESLVSVVIGAGAESIGDKAFDGCTGLSVIILGSYDPDSDTNLGESSLRSIGEYAFRKCSYLNDITMPDTLERVGMYAFSDSGLWSNANGVVYAGNWLVDYKTEDSYESVTVTDGTAGIAEYAFYGKSTLLGAYLPDSVKYIGRSAFYQCKSMSTVRLPAELTAIEDYTFYHCDKLALPTLPETLTRIGRSAFYKCSLVTESADTDSDQLIIPDSVTEIGDYAFYGCTFTYEDPNQTEESGELIKNGGIDAVVIGKNVQKIGAQSFAYMSALKSVVIGNSVQNIGEKAFYKCAELEDVTFGSNVRMVGDRAFYGCTSLRAAKLPSSVEKIGNYAFYKCASLSSVQLGNTKSIGDYAFYGCSSLTELQLPSSLISIGTQAFRNCTSLKSIYLRANISQIGAHAFYGCNMMTIYTDATSAQSGWNMRWNSSYRPVVWGCTFSADGYLVSFVYTETSITDKTSNISLSDPYREGFSFLGWSTSASGTAEFTNADLDTAPNGTTLYAVWSQTGAAE